MEDYLSSPVEEWTRDIEIIEQGLAYTLTVCPEPVRRVCKREKQLRALLDPAYGSLLERS